MSVSDKHPIGKENFFVFSRKCRIFALEMGRRQYAGMPVR
ncbi:hypothetical protein HMPREF1146_1616 [Prevotella sp. MSX73]|jgi:hypothetical protein|uniref:Uncharacterized protein n=1 Tax=Segatella buccae ATCC 33574 TaxID=873513 RepID=E6K7K8_9BACT|nr:hypothetical protein HMPREF0649_00518 [Segatella buccae D17]EFU30575.1 hypothetical protein HMPREF6485_1854 [Segatella buccae ATCC 33574]EJP33606.1 hypothetical protein HMPREF1146_1616 [Prevotella sp. MSX73]